MPHYLEKAEENEYNIMCTHYIQGYPIRAMEEK